MSDKGRASCVVVERRLDAVVPPGATTVDDLSQLLRSLSEAEGSTLSVQTPLTENHGEETIEVKNNVGLNTPVCDMQYSQDKNRVSPTSILDFPQDVVVEGVEVINDDCDPFSGRVVEDDLSNLRQPTLLLDSEVPVCTDTREGGTGKEEVDRSSSAEIREISSTTSNHFARSRSPSLITYYRNKQLCPADTFESDDDVSSSLGETESFDPFALADEAVEEFDDDSSNSTLENNVRWTYISNIDGSASVHPKFAPPVDDDDYLSATPAMSSASTAPRHSRRVSFDDMMQVRYFCRSDQEKVDMKLFSEKMRSQIRRRRRRSKLNLSDSSDEGDDRAMGLTVANKVLSHRDDDSISGIFADVVDEISDMITDVVIDAKRQQQRTFIRELEQDQKCRSSGTNALTISESFLESFSCIPPIRDDETSAKPSTISSDEYILQTWQSTAPSKSTSTDEPAPEEEEDDEPWFLTWTAMRCGSKCGNI